MMRILPLLSFLAILCLAHPADAIFLKPDLQKIPVEKLIANLEAQLDKEVKVTTPTRYNLARVHAMAYALKTETAEVTKKRAPGDGVYFGPTPPSVPFKAVETDDKEKLAAAKTHLEKAITHYREVIRDQPTFLPAHLGLAWCLEQAGKKDEAIAKYRETLDLGWDIDRKKKSGPLGGNFITKEAAVYLLPHLDKEKDADEIASIIQRVTILNKLPRPVTPIAIPLKDGLTARAIEDRAASVSFDVDGTNLGSRWTWITRDAAWLVHDPRGTGKISSGLQLFGNVTFWCFWDNGYQALRALDDNGDGVLSGPELRDLALWHDANANGICDAGEVRPLSVYGIVSLSCDYQTDVDHPERITYSPHGVTYRDGTTRPSFDLILQQR